jgi:hypothetical protein
MTTTTTDEITDLQRENGARPFGACTLCGAALMVWADDPNQEPKDIAQGMSYCGPLGRGDYQRHESNITMPLARQAVYLFGAWAGVYVSTGVCTCCDQRAEAEREHRSEPRPRHVFRYGGDNEEWGHLDDQTFAEVRHVHIDTGSRDCDSTYGGSHITRLNNAPCDWAICPGPNGASRTPDMHDLWNYLCGSLPSYSSGPTKIEVEDGQMRWHTDTDEGYYGGHARICSESWCAYDSDTFSDSTAESMNY